MTDDPEQTEAALRGQELRGVDGHDDTIRGDATHASARTSLLRGDSLGRYLILRKLGAGAMGVVYSAHDRELGREVAVKVLRTATEGSEGPARMLREAQALARLAHPNVVTIHDVGSDRGRSYITMELVDGLTLREWLGESPRSWQAIVAVVVDAARGLAAAHGKGLVHRDFKPDNVMIGRDGRVRVMDFGLARGTAVAADEPIAPPSTNVSGPLHTATGAIAGTPAYMSAEQWGGAVAGPASDQFALCATAWEALHGARPFSGASLPALCAAVSSGVIDEASITRDAPRWLRRVLARGLRVDPSERWSSVDALVAEIEGRLRRGRTLRWSIVVVGVVAAAAGFGRWQAGSEDRRREACRIESTQIDSLWNDRARATLEAAMQSSGAPYAAASFSTVAHEIDTWSQSWSASAERVCVAGGGGSEADSSSSGSARACLSDRRDCLELTLAFLGNGSSLGAIGAVDAVNDLPDPATCASPSLLSVPRSAPGLREEALEVRRQMLDARSRLESADVLAAKTLAGEAVARAETIGLVALAAEARILLAEAHEVAEELDAMIATLERAFTEASTAGAIEVAADAARLLAYAYSQYRTNPAAAVAWAAASDAALGPASAEDLRRVARLQHVRALMATAVGDTPRALELYDTCLALHRQTLGEDHPAVAAVYANRSGIYATLDQLERSEAAATRAVEILEDVYGESHPRVVTALLRLSTVVDARGRDEEALALARRSLSIVEATLGPDSRDAAYSHAAIGNALASRRDWRGVFPSYQRAVEIVEATLGRVHVTTASLLNNLANAYDGVGDKERAVELYREVVEIRRELLGPDAPEVAAALANLGDSLASLQRFDEAAEVLEDARRIYDAHRPIRVVGMGRALFHLGRVRREQGRLAEARATFESALALEDLGDATAIPRAHAKFALAGVLVESPASVPAERALAVTLAREAQQVAIDFDDGGLRTGVAAWLAAHAPD